MERSTLLTLNMKRCMLESEGETSDEPDPDESRMDKYDLRRCSNVQLAGKANWIPAVIATMKGMKQQDAKIETFIGNTIANMSQIDEGEATDARTYWDTNKGTVHAILVCIILF